MSNTNNSPPSLPSDNPCVAPTERPLRADVAGVIATRPHLFLYAGQNYEEGQAWPGAREARGIADAYAAVKMLAGGDPDEHIPMWNTVTKRILVGPCEFFFFFVR